MHGLRLLEEVGYKYILSEFRARMEGPASTPCVFPRHEN